ncbi:hypothetical protein EBN03_03470 [Nocardia stercoris]|uniref:PknH-like extracellular domain-containing protein n=2 Tax=Nocardia stercoris TaxID=2483361 RepID=A0A3M2LCU1_9NOCA|nr:hypothetical protein EBN03_03470 [Nocardia stercoris]
MALSFTAAGSPAAQAAPTAPTCTNTPNSYTAGWQSGWATYQAAQSGGSGSSSGSSTGSASGSATLSQTADLPITINAPIAHVFAVYSNLQNDIGRHPFLQAIYTHSVCSDGVTTTTDFTALENIPMGSATYPAQTEAQQNVVAAGYYYTTDSYDEPGVITHQKVTFVDNGNGTTSVNEHLTFVTNALLESFTVENGVASHQQCQAAIKRDIENGTL